MNSRVTVSASMARNMQRGTSLIFLAVEALRRYRPIIRSRQRVGDAKPQQAQPKAILINVAKAMQTGCKPSRRKQLVSDHAPFQTVALRAHAARGNGPKVNVENKRKERKPAAPFTTLYIALKADNVFKSAAKQPA